MRAKSYLVAVCRRMPAIISIITKIGKLQKFYPPTPRRHIDIEDLGGWVKFRTVNERQNSWVE